MRIDAYLVDTGTVRSRQRAKEALRAGRVRINGAVVSKASASVHENDCVECDGETHPYVSRGALKLEAGLDTFAFDPAGKACLDIGASTGGFTEVLLARSARRIFSVDVGTGQLDPSLRDDSRVVSLERTDARHLTRDAVGDTIDLIVVDVSFISLMKALPVPLSLCGAHARALVLVKPQFELGRDHLGKGGIVTMPLQEQRVWVGERIVPFFLSQGWREVGMVESPIKGGDGNTEFLLGAQKTA